jgi:hypothetical protein
MNRIPFGDRAQPSASTPSDFSYRAGSGLVRHRWAVWLRRGAVPAGLPPATPYQQPPADVPPTGLLPLHWAELQASAIAADVAAANVASWGPGTPRHWEAERAELVAYARLQLQTASTTASGLPQAQPGFLA